MKETKKLAFSAITVALGVAFMLLGAVFEPLDLASSCLASVLLLFIYIEVGAPYTYLVWLCTSLISFIVYPTALMWVMYLLVFGIYPILKGYIERAPRALWWPLKLLFGAVSLTALFLITSFVLGVPLVDEGLFGLPTPVIYAATALLGALCFLLYDIFLTAAVRVYYSKIRNKLKNILK
ncbi:MAG: hypothetical protein IJW48_00875 [Clostridia bacterium]|nr:hypothetical protein [Clostridia bacterium]